MACGTWRMPTMNIARGIVLICTLLTFAFTAARATAQEKSHVDRPIIAPRPGDVSTIEGIVNASYETISGGVGVPRDWGRDRTLFDPESRSAAVAVDPKTGAFVAATF
jgi:hypothetical protein